MEIRVISTYSGWVMTLALMRTWQDAASSIGLSNLFSITGDIFPECFPFMGKNNIFPSCLFLLSSAHLSRLNTESRTWATCRASASSQLCRKPLNLPRGPVNLRSNDDRGWQAPRPAQLSGSSAPCCITIPQRYPVRTGVPISWKNHRHTTVQCICCATIPGMASIV
jgi:hypothetical protein